MSQPVHVTLGEVCTIESALVDPRVSPHSSRPHVGGANIVSDTGQLIDLKTAEEEKLISGKFLFTEADVLYSKIRPYLRKVAVPSFTGLCSADIYPLRPCSDRIDREYLYYLLLSDEFTEYAVRVSNRAGMPKVNREQLFAFKCLLPAVAEQRRIVARVGECMLRLEEMGVLRGAADQEAKALLPSSLAAVFDDLRETCRWTPLEMVLVDTRYGTSRKCADGEDATPVLRIPNVACGRISFENLKYCVLDTAELKRLVLEPGDLLVVRTNGSQELVGRCAVFEGAPTCYAFASYLIRMRVDLKSADPRFLSFFFASTYGRDAIAAIRRTSAGQFNVNCENLRAIQVPLPALGEQARIVERLHDQQMVAQAIAAEQAVRMSETAQLRAAVLRRAFVGDL